jgi:succinate-acetate transporter protein
MSNQERLGNMENKYDDRSFSSSPVIVTPVVANPGPLGLFAVAVTVFILALHNLGAGLSPTGPNNVVVGVSFFYGGIIQVPNWGGFFLHEY